MANVPKQSEPSDDDNNKSRPLWRFWRNNSFVMARVAEVKHADPKGHERLRLDVLSVVSTEQLIPMKVWVDYDYPQDSNNNGIGELVKDQTIFACLNKKDGDWRISPHNAGVFYGCRASVRAITGLDDPVVKEVMQKIDACRTFSRIENDDYAEDERRSTGGSRAAATTQPIKEK